MEKRLINLDLKGKNALVTGGAQGIGAAIAKTLADNGANVAVNDYGNIDKAQVLVEEFKAGGVDAVAIQADMSNPEDVERLVYEAQEALGGPIDILVNNAGSQIKQSSIEEMPVELWDKVMGLNLTGAMICAKCVIPGMKQNRWGRIINIASISGRSGGGPGGSHYAASKAGMVSLTKSLAKELGPYGATANAIAPGVVMTEIHEKFSTKESLEQLKDSTVLGYLGQTEDLAGTALFLASDSAAYITGETIAVNGGLRMD
jgi:3-oxoacyl-[acyl-carrier protein] reductase